MNAFTLTGPSLARVGAVPAARPPLPRTASVVSDPEWLAQGFDPSGRAMDFVHVPRAALRELSFLTDQALRQHERRTIPLDVVERCRADLHQVPVHYVFHTAFCGSTLLARALEALGAGAALKEPGLLTNLVYHLPRWNDGGSRQRIDLAVALLARPVESAPATIVKPSCFASSLAPALLGARPESRAIFLSSSLEDFLAAVAKRSIRGRAWARRAFADATRHMPFDFNFAPSELLELTDLQIAGLTWLMRTHFLRRTAASLGQHRILELQFDELAEAPQSTLLRAANFLGTPCSEERVRDALASPVFGVHAKQDGQAFTMTDRERELSEIRAAHREELETVAGWVRAVAAGFGLECPPPRSAH